MKKITFLLLILATFSCKMETNTSTKQTEIDTEKFQTVVDSIYKAHPESIGIMVHIESPKNGISWSGSAGYSNKDIKTKLLPDQPALIASNIKTYVSAAILRLQEEEKLNIDDPIGEHLPQKTLVLFQNDGYAFNKIKIKHLLSHTSGIADYVNDDYFEFINKNQQHRWTRDEQLQLAVNVGDPIGKPQEVFKYADVNYLLATEIIEQKTQKPFYIAMRELLKYDDLGLTNTWFPTLEKKPEQTKELVHQYWKEENWGKRKLNFNWDSYAHDISWDLYGGGGIATNMKELAQFSYNLFNEKIIQDKEVLNLIKTDVTTTDGIPKTYRLGVADATIKGLQSIGHGGFWGTQVFHMPQLNASISVCVLERNGKMKIIKGKLNTLIAELTKQIYPFEHIVHKDYDLYKVTDSKATLVLFPGGAATSKQTKEEFDILTAAAANDVSVVFMNFNRHFWIDDNEKNKLMGQLNHIVEAHQLNKENIHIGGMSIGGNVALLLTNHLLEHNITFKPKGVFIVDSPIDLNHVYLGCKNDLLREDFTEERLEEPKFIVEYLEDALKAKDEAFVYELEKVSPFTLETKNIDNIEQIKNIKFNLYTEPDAKWWKEVRGINLKETNSFSIQQLHELLTNNNWEKVALIETENKGYRSNGEKHPHSWSIVDARNLMEWMNE